ncbi:MAG: hypothetical protein HoeaKO_14630 [Hoeflea alexandrii]
MPDIGAPHPRRTIDEFAPPVVMDINPLARAKHAASFCANRARRGPWLDQVIGGILSGLFKHPVVRFGHDADFPEDLSGARLFNSPLRQMELLLNGCSINLTEKRLAFNCLLTSY